MLQGEILLPPGRLGRLAQCREPHREMIGSTSKMSSKNLEVLNLGARAEDRFWSWKHQDQCLSSTCTRRGFEQLTQPHGASVSSSGKRRPA